MSSSPRLRAAVSAALLTAALLSPVGSTAVADTRPAGGVPGTVSSDSLPTAQLTGGVAWAQAVVGGTVYVGGSFTGALPPRATSGAVSRGNLLSYDLATGALNPFAPTTNAQVMALAAAPDGSTLYLAGAFTTVNGVARNHLAAIDLASGSVTAWNPNVNGTVNAVAATADTVFFGGQFTAVGGVTRTRAAAVSAVTGVPTAFAPTGLDNAVKSLAIGPGATRIALGGFFSTIDGAGGSGFGIVDTATGRDLLDTPIRQAVDNGSTTSAIWGVSSDGTNVYGSGYYTTHAADRSGNLEGTFAVSWATGATTWIEECHGDEYGSASFGGALYIVGHPHYCYDIEGGYPESQNDPNAPNPLYQRTLAFTTAATSTVKPLTLPLPRYYDRSGQPAPSLLSWFPTLSAGTFTGSYQAAYTVTASGGYLLEAGEFPKVNGSAQYGLARFALPSIAPNKDGPQLAGSAWPLSASTLSGGTARVAWLANYDRDSENLTYTLYRGSTVVTRMTAASRIWAERPTLAYTDTGVAAGSTVTYRVTATDAWGNTATSAVLTYAVPATTQSRYAQQVVADGATSYWRLDQASGATVLADTAGGLPAAPHGAVTLGVPGAIAGDSDTAALFDGADTTGIATTAFTDPTDTFSVEAWFRTTATTGGEIIGGGDLQKKGRVSTTNDTGVVQTLTSDSLHHDREISTTGDGHVTFTVFPGTARTVTSGSGGYNDGTWHHVVGTLSSAGQMLYVDGSRVATDPASNRAVGLMEFWRIGGDSVYANGGGGYFTGAIDEPAAYIGTALTSAQVADHCALGHGTTTADVPPTASFTAALDGSVVTVDGSASSDPDGTIASYRWDFGDGSTGSGSSATHTYAASGMFRITLTVTDDLGAADSTSRQVDVAAPAPATLASDGFGRSTTGGLGAADTGGPYTVSGTAANYSVTGGAARLVTAKSSTKRAVLGSVSSSDTDLTLTLSPSSVPVGGSLYTDVIGRAIGSDDYRARLILAASGALTLQVDHGATALKSVPVPGPAVSAGDVLRVRVQVTGTSPTTVRARVWRAGTAEPTAWQVSATDTTAALQAPGSVGFGSYLGSGVTNGPVTVSVDDLLAVPAGG